MFVVIKHEMRSGSWTARTVLQRQPSTDQENEALLSDVPLLSV